MDRWEINRTAIKCYVLREVVDFGTLGRLKWHPKNVLLKTLNGLFKIHTTLKRLYRM